jgi:hypothetical protein
MNQRPFEMETAPFIAVRQMEFRPINGDEYKLVAKMLDRGKLHESLKSRGLLDARIGYSEDGKFTTAMLIRETRDGYQMIHVGASKRITYAPTSDPDDQEIGRTIAFCRAVGSDPIGLPPLEVKNG